MENTTIFLGCYTRNKNQSKGIYALKQMGTKIDTIAHTHHEVNNPTYLLKNNEFIYTIESNDDKSGGVAVYSYQDGTFTFLDKMIQEFAGPCHIDIDKTQKYLLTSHYHAGKLELHEIKNGKIISLKQIINHKKYEDEHMPKSHVHFAQFTKDNQYIVTCDLGLNRVFVYPFNQKDGEIDETSMVYYQLPVGKGPRHFVFNENEDKIYVINELSGSLLTFSFFQGKLTLLDEHFPEVLQAHTTTGDGGAIRLHPNGKYLYTSLRSSLNMIICYQLDKQGMPQQIAEVSTNGDHPRDFNITKDGKYLFVANQNTDDIFTFAIHEDGTLTDLHERFNVPSPVCLVVE